MQFADEAAGSAALAALLAGKDGKRSATARDDTCTVVVSQVGLSCSQRTPAESAQVSAAPPEVPLWYRAQVWHKLRVCWHQRVV